MDFSKLIKRGGRAEVRGWVLGGEIFTMVGDVGNKRGGGGSRNKQGVGVDLVDYENM